MCTQLHRINSNNNNSADNKNWLNAGNHNILNANQATGSQQVHWAVDAFVVFR